MLFPYRQGETERDTEKQTKKRENEAKEAIWIFVTRAAAAYLSHRDQKPEEEEKKKD